MFNKKGLSDIVTNVLIILLVLVAVTIIWFFLQPTIRGGAGQLGGVNECITVQLEAVRCELNTGTTYDVEVIRRPGEGNVQNVTLIFGTTSGNILFGVGSPAVSGLTALDELESWTGTVDVGAAATEISVAASIDPGNGVLRVCPASTPITCG